MTRCYVSEHDVTNKLTVCNYSCLSENQFDILGRGSENISGGPHHQTDL